MASIRHPNCCSFLGICVAPPAIVSEFCPRGSLCDILRQARQGVGVRELTWQRRLSMVRVVGVHTGSHVPGGGQARERGRCHCHPPQALDAAKALLYLHNHSPPIIHRDGEGRGGAHLRQQAKTCAAATRDRPRPPPAVKSPNLLVAADWQVRVADFNLSKVLEAQTTTHSTNGPNNPMWLVCAEGAGQVGVQLHATACRPQAGLLAGSVLACTLRRATSCRGAARRCRHPRCWLVDGRRQRRTSMALAWSSTSCCAGSCPGPARLCTR